MSGIKQAIDQSVPKLIEQLGLLVNPLILQFKDESKQLLIFYFHGIYKNELEKDLHHCDPQNNVTIDQLSEFIQYFQAQNYRFLSLEDLNNDVEDDAPAVMMTFDDGYFNNTLAIPLLEKYNVPGNFFIASRFVAENISYWWDIVYKFRMKEGKSLPSIREEQEGLKAHHYTYINDYILQNFGEEATTPWSDVDRPMTPAELQTFAAHPLVFIGNHTKHHAILTCYGKQEIKNELIACNDFLKQTLGFTPNTIAYPNGNYSDLVLETTKECGFEYAFTTVPQIMPLPHRKRVFNLMHRFMPEPRSIKEYGSFCRMNYEPKQFYHDTKMKALALLFPSKYKSQDQDHHSGY